MNKPVLTALSSFLIITFLLPFAAFAQKQAYALYGADTVKGTTNYSRSSRSPVSFNFTPKDYIGFQTISAGDVTEFGILDNGQQMIYRSFEVEIDRSPVTLSALDESPEPRMAKRKKIFALTLVSGPAQLYNYTDDLKDHYIFKKKDGVAFELINKSYIDLSTKRSMTNSGYKKQLYDNTADCSTMSVKSVKDLSFTEGALRKYITTYNACMGASATEVFVKSKVNYRWGGLAGLAFTNLSLGNSTGAEYIDAKIAGKILPAAGISFSIDPLNSKFNLMAEIMYKQHQATGTYTKTSPNVSNKYDFEFDTKSIKLNILCKYFISKAELKTYLFGGFAGASVFSDNSKLKQTKSFYNDTQVSVINDGNARGFQLGVLGGVGAEFNKIGLQARYEVNQPYVSFVYYKVKYNTAYLMLTYSF